MPDGVGFAFQKAIDRDAKFGVLQPMPRMGGGGHQAARQFVFALGAAFKHLQTMRDGVLDTLLIAGLEVKAGDVFQCAPVPAIKPLAVFHAERAGNRDAVPVGHDEHQVVRHSGAHIGKKSGIEMRLTPVPCIRVGITAQEMRPVGIGAVAAFNPAKSHACCRKFFSFLANFLAFVVRHRGEERIETGVVRVMPVELKSTAMHERCLRCRIGIRRGAISDLRKRQIEHGVVRLGGKQNVERRKSQIAREPECRLNQGCAVSVAGRQQSRTRHRRERDAAYEFGVVVEPMATVGIGPGPVEHEFAPGMVLDVERHRRRKTTIPEQGKMDRFPTDVGADTTRGFQRVQKSVAQEGRIACKRVPFRRIQFCDARDHANNSICGFRIRGLCFKMHVLVNFHYLMNLHEYQAKHILRSGNITTPRGLPATSADAAVAAAGELGGQAWVVKAQIHAGGRGKAGGVELVDRIDAVREAASRLLGTSLVTHQNAPEGQPVNRVLVEETLPIARELYLSLLVDRESGRVAIVASASGGVDIEEVAQLTPEKVLTEICDPLRGVQDFQCRALAFALELEGDAFKAFCRLVPALYRVFVAHDLSLLEINPLVVTRDNRVLPLDCKMSVDDNALYRHTQLADLRDDTQIDAKEAAAHAANVNYVALHGNIGCMVNGAGLAMATMDLIQLEGGSPANFLDVGGGATPDTVAQGFKIILLDPNVRAVLINIFGGIVRCDVIAEGIIQAVKEVGVKVPVIVRLEGTNAVQGRALLAESGLAILAAESLTQAARFAVEKAQ